MSETAIKSESLGSAVLLDVSRARRNYIVFVLFLVGAFNFLDRQVLTILIEPIRKELSLSDTQIGFLAGIVFTIVQVTLGIPAARLSDSWSRRKVITLAIGIWSLMTALCGVAVTFPQMLLVRMGVGVGQSGGSPPCQAFISDLYRLEERSTAMGAYLISVPAGIGLGLLIGGWAVGEFGWRGAFILAGVPGLLLAPLVFFTLPETRKVQAASTQPASPPFFATIRWLFSVKAYRNLLFGSATQTFLTLGITAWFPSFLARSHGMHPAEIGLKLTLAFAIPYAFGTLFGGRLTDILVRRDLRWYFWIPTITVLMSGALLAGVFLAPTAYVFWFMIPNYIVAVAFSGASSVVAQSLAPVSYRATVHAVMLFVVNMVGFGLGPQAVGIVSDLLHPTYGEESLRLTLLLGTAIAIPAALFYFQGSKSYIADKAAADKLNVA